MGNLGKLTKSTIFVAFLWIIQSVGRFFFGYLSAITPEGLLDAEVSQAIIQIIDAMFFLLGILGFIAVVGLLSMKKGGFWATVLVSVATIVFDMWGLTIQYTATMGFIVPAILILYLYFKKSQLLATMK